MKANIILVALFAAAFMFPSIGSVDTADAQAPAAHEPTQIAQPAGALETAGSSAPHSTII